MNILDSIEIHGLWASSEKPIKFKLNKNFNFLIGQNGTGKTTVINLLAAALDADFERLDKIEFSKLMIKLQPLSGLKKPVIQIIKTQKPNVPYYDIQYLVSDSVTSKPIQFDLDALAEERSYRGLPPRVLKERYFKEKFLDVQRHLESLVKVCWLSVNRHADENDTDERVQRSAVDKKLSLLNVELSKYFSYLNSQYHVETREFQKQSFLSLLTSEQENVLKAFSNNIDIDEEKKNLAKAFEILGMQPPEYERKINTHFTKFQEARRAFTGNGGVSITQFSAIYNAWKSHALVQFYENLTTKKLEIYQPRQNFIEVINELFAGRKYIEISERNEIIVFTKDQKKIMLGDLSSGEKQLLIILGEALLQRGEKVIYIADEPELSLHVTWQEQLTNSIAKLNPNSQIIFATHSPDIVSTHSDNVIDMETLVP